MKALIFLLVLATTNSSISLAQCGKKLLLSTSQTVYLDSSGNVTRTEDEKSVIHISQSEVTVSVNDEHKMAFPVKSNTCNWEVPFKKGKSSVKGALSRDNGDPINVTMDIEGKDGKVILLFKMEGRPVTIKLVLDKFEEEH